jgi:hypothetical protein
MRAPIIRTGLYHEPGYQRRQRITVYGGLHYIVGNKAPYFSLTSETRSSSGCNHERILALYPEYADLAALHLSDIDGCPSHSVENAWYWFAGSKGGLGERFHGANAQSNKHGGFNTEDECAQIFANHVRISLEKALMLRETIGKKAHLKAWCEDQRPRWKKEADDCIARHKLRVYGAAWIPDLVA